MYNKRFRNWFLTINEDAECYNYKILTTTLDDLKCAYALILHDKDNEEQPHYHLWIKYENGKTFETMKKIFKGAHIEVMRECIQSCKYLCHRTLESKNKYQYPYEEVISNFDYSTYIAGYSDSNIDFDIKEFMLKLYKGDFKLGLAAIILEYGIEQYKTNRLIIQDLLKDYSNGVHFATYEKLKDEIGKIEVSKNEEENKRII